MDDQLDRVRRAYDLTVSRFRQGIDPYDTVPVEIRNTDFYRSLSSVTGLNSGAPDVREFLAPESGMKFLDAGCSANLANYGLGDWPSAYYGVDISPALVRAMKGYAERNGIPVGGLHVAELSVLPFGDDFFDIAAVIGVLEYCPPEHTGYALDELHRVLKPGAKAVLDIPNPDHPHAPDMQKLEEHLGRPIFLHSRTEFEGLLSGYFHTVKTDDSRVMIKYFVKKKE